MTEHSLGSVRALVKAKLHDSEFDDEQINQFINDELLSVLGEEKYPFMEGYDETREFRGGELSVPNDWQATLYIIARTKKHGGNKLEYVAPEKWFNGERTNFSYTVFSGQVLFDLPKHGEIPCAWTVKHYYLAKPVELVNDEDVPQLPSEFSEILVLGALKRAEQRRDNFDFAAIYENERRELVENMKIRLGQRNLSFGSRARVPYGRR